MPKINVLVMTLGGSLEPLVKSLEAHGPDKVHVLCSPQSVDLLATLRGLWPPLAKGQVPLGHDVIDDVEKLDPCYSAIRKVLDKVSAENTGASLRLDYTGGTKTMSAAAVLAAVDFGMDFSYIGGERLRGGMGAVMDGREQMFDSPRPWDLVKKTLVDRAIVDFNAYRFRSAQAGFEALDRRLNSGETGSIYGILARISQGYASWDRFEIEKAAELLTGAVRGYGEYCENSGPNRLRNQVLRGALAKHVEYLRALSAASKANQGRLPANQQVYDDLVANASRRLSENKLEDATARLYRALELAGQIAFKRRFGVETEMVRAETMPPEIWARISKPGLEWKHFALSDTWYALFLAKDDEGLAYGRSEKEFSEILEARNRSILGHGFRPVNHAGLVEGFRDLLLKLKPIQNVIIFPTLE